MSPEYEAALGPLLDLAPALAAVAAVIATVWAFARKVLPTMRRIGHLVDDLTGEPARPGQPARPGMMERLATVETRTAELVPNGGGSIKDAIGRLERKTADIDARLAVVESNTNPGMEAPR